MITRFNFEMNFDLLPLLDEGSEIMDFDPDWPFMSNIKNQKELYDESEEDHLVWVEAISNPMIDE